MEQLVFWNCECSIAGGWRATCLGYVNFYTGQDARLEDLHNPFQCSDFMKRSISMKGSNKRSPKAGFWNQLAEHVLRLLNIFIVNVQIFKKNKNQWNKVFTIGKLRFYHPHLAEHPDCFSPQIFYKCWLKPLRENKMLIYFHDWGCLCKLLTFTFCFCDELFYSH